MAKLFLRHLRRNAGSESHRRVGVPQTVNTQRRESKGIGSPPESPRDGRGGERRTVRLREYEAARVVIRADPEPNGGLRFAVRTQRRDRDPRQRHRPPSMPGPTRSSESGAVRPSASVVRCDTRPRDDVLTRDPA